MKTLRGYHFVGKTLHDGRPVPEDGVWLVHEGSVVPCESGLHMSEHPLDALCYAPGATLCLVELRGDLQPHGDPIDKWAGRERCIIKRIDATQLLRRFAADQALSVKHLWNMPRIVERYLTTLDEKLREAARNVAWSVAWNTTRAEAAEVAAREAVWAVREDEAWLAAWAAEAATWVASREIAWEIAWEAARAEFKRRVEETFNS